MPTAARITRNYLRGLPVGCAPERSCENSALSGDIYGNAFLTRPVFFGRSESRAVGARLSGLYDLLLALPHRLYGGDLRLFTAALGWSPEQIGATLRADGRPRELPRCARADLYREEDGFRLLELNGGSPLGGWDIALLNRALLQEPYIASFAEEHHLEFTDGIEVLLDLWRESFPGLDLSTNPVVGLLEWPDNYSARVTPAPDGRSARLTWHRRPALPPRTGGVPHGRGLRLRAPDRRRAPLVCHQRRCHRRGRGPARSSLPGR
ncbi:hypothetical protein ACIQ9Q_25660 [Streptomyces sp. NPDC094438]|uniref:hypothetical protein n=1 Tax=Streptomyces sp. NPDC094438 TaxID=3366061 RepID=UPI0038031143